MTARMNGSSRMRARERAAIVEWLRKEGVRLTQQDPRERLDHFDIANMIENGAHIQ